MKIGRTFRLCPEEIDFVAASAIHELSKTSIVNPWHVNLTESRLLIATKRVSGSVTREKMPRTKAYHDYN